MDRCLLKWLPTIIVSHYDKAKVNKNPKLATAKKQKSKMALSPLRRERRDEGLQIKRKPTPDGITNPLCQVSDKQKKDYIYK